jgi:hypothetical protein
MKRMLLLVGLLAVALATVGAQSALAAPTLTGFAPASGPASWSVTLTGTGFTGATSVTFTPVDTSFSPAQATFVVKDDTTIVATVPFLATKPLAATLTVQTPGGPVTSETDFTVDGRVGLSEHRGARGEPVTLSGAGFTGTTTVVFGTWRTDVPGNEPFSTAHPVRASFRVVSDTKIAAVVPALRTGRYWVVVLSPLGKSVSKHSTPFRVVRPRLLRDTFSNRFAIRPATVIPVGDSSFLIGRLFKTGRGHAISWPLWSARRADGVGTVWIDNGIPNEAQGTFHGFPGSIDARRSRGGHFTRMTVAWQQGGHRHSELLKLAHNTSGWFWR